MASHPLARSTLHLWTTITPGDIKHTLSFPPDDMGDIDSFARVPKRNVREAARFVRRQPAVYTSIFGRSAKMTFRLDKGALPLLELSAELRNMVYKQAFGATGPYTLKGIDNRSCSSPYCREDQERRHVIFRCDHCHECRRARLNNMGEDVLAVLRHPRREALTFNSVYEKNRNSPDPGSAIPFLTTCKQVKNESLDFLYDTCFNFPSVDDLLLILSGSVDISRICHLTLERLGYPDYRYPDEDEIEPFIACLTRIDKAATEAGQDVEIEIHLQVFNYPSMENVASTLECVIKYKQAVQQVKTQSVKDLLTKLVKDLVDMWEEKFAWDLKAHGEKSLFQNYRGKWVAGLMAAGVVELKWVL